VQRAFIPVSRYVKIIKIYQDFCRVITTDLLPLFMNHMYTFISASALTVWRRLTLYYTRYIMLACNLSVI